jgi:hypothetical protein
MISKTDIKWGGYLQYEGPYFLGNQNGKFILSDNPSEDEKIIAVITATEGGSFNAVNMYDSGICSTGIIQWIESGQYSVSDMLCQLVDIDRQLIKPVDDLCSTINLSFKKNQKSRCRFFFNDVRGEVDRLEEQRQMFLLNSTGKVGTWDDDSTEYAKQWVISIASIFENEIAKKEQLKFTAKRLSWFCLPFAKGLINQAPDSNIGRAFKAAYLSFAANNPTIANKHLEVGVKNNPYQAWSIDWFIFILKELTFGPGITIYPGRYDKIRPVIEKLYGINLIDFSSDLKNWSNNIGEDKFIDTKEVQQILLKLGFDLGPKRDDGVLGGKTKLAILLFQQINGINQTGNVDDKTIFSDSFKEDIKNMVKLSMSKLAIEAVQESTDKRM